MMHIMMNRKFVIATASLLVLSSLSVFAQNNEEPKTNKSEYNTNWFIGAGGGINTMSGFMSGDSFNIHLKGNGYDTHVQPGAEVFFGKWYTPRFGVRFGAQGGKYSTKLDEPTVAQYNGLYMHGDMLWSATSWLTPYAHAGILSLWKPGETGWAAENEMVAGLGLIASANLSDKLALYLDTRSLIMPKRVADIEDSRFTSILSYSVGMKYNLENQGQSKKSFIGTFAQPNSTDYSQNFSDDMFFQIGGGVNTLQSANGYGWNGRITPAYEIAVGKWLTNTLATRVGLQGHSFSHWGEEASDKISLGQFTYKDQQLYKERFAFEYLHADLLWDVTSMIGGYRSDRTWSFIPYLHAGYMIGYSDIKKLQILNNEWTGGAGLLNTFRVNDELSLYLDARAFAMNHNVTNDATDGYTFALSGLAGIYYDLNTQSVRYHGYSAPTQEEKAQVRQERIKNMGEYATNWFAGANVGVNTMFSLGADNGFDTKLRPSTEVYIGKWYTPSVGVRFGAQIGQWAPKTGVSDIERYNGGYFHGDFLVAATNWLTPYAHAGIISLWQPGQKGWAPENEVAAGLGLIANANITDRWSIYGDLRSTLMPQRVLDVEGARFTGMLSASAGLKYSLEGNGSSMPNFLGTWRDSNSTRTSTNFTDDMFYQIGGGVNTLQSFNGYGFDGRFTPVGEVAIGKWFSNTFATRIGMQNSAFSHWGEGGPENVTLEKGTFKGEQLYKERFGYNYLHFDLMWDLTSMLGGYDPFRAVSVIPYLHAGWATAYTNIDKVKALNNEWMGGAGILNTFRVNDKTSVYVDLRGYLLNHEMTTDPKDGYTAAASLTAGVYHDLFRQRVRFHTDEPLGEANSLAFLWPKNTEHAGPYIYNGILDNWFIGGSLGAATLTNSVDDNKWNTNFDAYVGKWFSPSFGMRLGYQGSEVKYAETSKYGYIHGDLMWNMLNTVLDYKENRTWEVIPYLHGGVLSTEDNGSRNNFATGAGLVNSIALNDRLRFNVDVRSTFAKGRITNSNNGENAIALAAMGGLSIDLGKNYWGPGQGILLNDIWENWFIQSAGGVGTMGYKLDGVGFNGRITPAEEVMVGKWFSPTVGVRAGVQGVALSAWGDKPSSSVDYLQENHRHYNLEIDKFSANYVHADMLFNLTNAINYNEERTFDVIPYSHIGYYNNYSSNTTKAENINKEYAIGGGIILSKDLDNKVSLYTDLRGSAYKHHMTEDASAKYAWGASATVGLTYNLGGGKSDLYDSNSWRHLPQDRFDQEEPAVRWAISTNLYDYADLGTANIEVQRVLGRNITSDMILKANLWNFKDGEMRDNRQDFQIGLRYWPWYTYSGIYVKGFAQVEEYATGGLNKFFTLGRGEGPEKGSAYGVGAGFGYSLMLAKHFNLDFGLTGWAGYRDYFKFNDAKFSKPVEHNHKMFAAPADFNISLMWVF